MRLTINLATRRYLNVGRLNAWLVAGILVSGLLLLFQVRELAYQQGELVRLRELGAAAAGRGPGQEVSEAQMKSVSAKVRFANELIAKKTVNWLQLLDALEEVVPNGVTLTQIEPAAHEQPLRLSGAARSFDDLRALLEGMERSGRFSDVYLLNQTETKVGLTQQGINFSLSCKVNER